MYLDLGKLFKLVFHSACIMNPVKERKINW